MRANLSSARAAAAAAVKAAQAAYAASGDADEAAGAAAAALPPVLEPREEAPLPEELRAAVAAALDVPELREPPGVAAGDDRAAAVADAARKAWSSLAFRSGLRDFLNGLVSGCGGC